MRDRLDLNEMADLNEILIVRVENQRRAQIAAEVKRKDAERKGRRG